MSTRAFIKMHGLGNDFVVVDARAVPFALDDGRPRALADRRRHSIENIVYILIS